MHHCITLCYLSTEGKNRCVFPSSKSTNHLSSRKELRTDNRTQSWPIIIYKKTSTKQNQKVKSNMLRNVQHWQSTPSQHRSVINQKEKAKKKATCFRSSPTYIYTVHLWKLDICHYISLLRISRGFCLLSPSVNQLDDLGVKKLTYKYWHRCHPQTPFIRQKRQSDFSFPELHRLFSVVKRAFVWQSKLLFRFVVDADMG